MFLSLHKHVCDNVNRHVTSVNNCHVSMCVCVEFAYVYKVCECVFFIFFAYICIYTVASLCIARLCQSTYLKISIHFMGMCV